MEGIVHTEPAPANGELESTYPWSLTHEQQVRNLVKNCKRAFDWTEDYGHCFNRKPSFERVVSQLKEELQEDPFLDRRNKREFHECEIDEFLLGGFVSGVSMTSLDLAILMGDLKMVRKIFEKSSDLDNLMCGPRMNPKKDSAVCEDPKKDSTICEDLKMVRKIFEKRFDMGNLMCGLQMNAKKDSTICEDLPKIEVLYRPLHLAVVNGDWYIINELVKKGANVNDPSFLYRTPLDLAWKLQEVGILKQLLKEDKEKKDVAHVAVLFGDVDLMKKYFYPEVNVVDGNKKTPLHHLASKQYRTLDVGNIVQYLADNKAIDIKALDDKGFSAFYAAVLCCNTKLVIALLHLFKDQILLNEDCDENRGPPIQIAFEGGHSFKNIDKALMQCEPVRGYLDKLYRDRQVYVDAANAILVGAALIASVTFASWLQPPLNYTSYSGEEYLSSVPTPSTSNLSYVDVEHNIALRAFWIFNALSFYFAIATVVCGARSVLPRSHLFIKKIVDKLRTNLLATSILLACSVLFVIVAFAIAGTIVLTPLVKYQWCMIVPTIVGGIVCLISLGFLVKSMWKIYSLTIDNSQGLSKKDIDYLKDNGYIVQDI